MYSWQSVHLCYNTVKGASVWYGCWGGGGGGGGGYGRCAGEIPGPEGRFGLNVIPLQAIKSLQILHMLRQHSYGVVSDSQIHPHIYFYFPYYGPFARGIRRWTGMPLTWDQYLNAELWRFRALRPNKLLNKRVEL